MDVTMGNSWSSVYDTSCWVMYTQNAKCHRAVHCHASYVRFHDVWNSITVTSTFRCKYYLGNICVATLTILHPNSFIVYDTTAGNSLRFIRISWSLLIYMQAFYISLTYQLLFSLSLSLPGHSCLCFQQWCCECSSLVSQCPSTPSHYIMGPPLCRGWVSSQTVVGTQAGINIGLQEEEIRCVSPLGFVYYKLNTLEKSGIGLLFPSLELREFLVYHLIIKERLGHQY